MSPVILVAIDGSESDAFWSEVADLVPPASSILVLHVVDEGPRRELDIQFLRRPGHPRPPDLDARATAAERRGSEAILAEAAQRLDAVTGSVQTVWRAGRPEHEIVAAAAEADARLVVVAARPEVETARPGPHSVGHVARFVIDHAPCPVLLVRCNDSVHHLS